MEATQDSLSRRVAVFRSSLLKASETFIRDQARALRQWDPVLVGFRRVPGGLDIEGIPCRVVPDGGRNLFQLRKLLARPVPGLVRALEQLRVRLVHVHFGTDAVDVWPSIRAARLPMLVTLHGYDINTRREWWEAGGSGLVRRFYPRRLLAIAHEPSVRFAAVSTAIRDEAVAFGIPPDRIQVSYVGIDTHRFTPGGLPVSQRQPRILFVGRMVEKKAPLVMIHAFARLHQRVSGAELLMIGDGPLLPEAMQLAAELRVPVRFLGSCTPEEVRQQLHDARVLCLPSVTAGNGDAEGFGLVLLEAQACGVPVVTSARGGGIEGLIPGVTGHRVAEGDVAGLASSLEVWLVADALAELAFSAAPRFVRDRFDIQRCVAQLELMYDMASTTTRGS